MISDFSGQESSRLQAVLCAVLVGTQLPRVLGSSWSLSSLCFHPEASLQEGGQSYSMWDSEHKAPQDPTWLSGFEGGRAPTPQWEWVSLAAPSHPPPGAPLGPFLS